MQHLHLQWFDWHKFIKHMKKKRIKLKHCHYLSSSGSVWAPLCSESRNISPSLVRKARQEVHSPSVCEWPRSNLLLLWVNSVFRRVKCWEWCATVARWSQLGWGISHCTLRKTSAYLHSCRLWTLAGLLANRRIYAQWLFTNRSFQVDCMADLFWLLKYSKIPWQKSKISNLRLQGPS